MCQLARSTAAWYGMRMDISIACKRYNAVITVTMAAYFMPVDGRRDIYPLVDGT